MPPEDEETKAALHLLVLVAQESLGQPDAELEGHHEAGSEPCRHDRKHKAWKYTADYYWQGSLNFPVSVQ